MCTITRTAGVVTILHLLSATVGGQLVNPGFETGDLTGWIKTGGVAVRTNAPGVSPTEGAHFALLHATNDANLVLSQSFVANAGAILHYDFAAITEGGPYSGSFGVRNLDNGMWANQLSDTSGMSPWTQAAWLLPTTGNYEVQFSAYAEGAATLDIYIDNVRLVGNSPRPGDFNGDGAVNAADYVLWRKGLGTAYTQSDYNVWRANFGAAPTGSGTSTMSSIPEPSALLLVTLGLVHLLLIRNRNM